jgi:hypothetical protein
VSPACTKHRLARIDVVGDEIEGLCSGCGERVVVPALANASKLVVRLMGLQERVMALGDQPSCLVVREIVGDELLGEFVRLAAQVQATEADTAIAHRLIRLLRARLSTLLGPEPE